MTKIAIPFACLSLVASAFAGQEVKETKDYKAPAAEPCFRDTELQIGIFGSYTDSVKRSPHADGLGGGVEVNYFFMRYLGIGVDGNIFNGDVNGVWDFSGRLIARIPIETGSICIAPYAFAGGGVEANGDTVGTWLVGGGLEWRATHHLGIFGEGRYTWGADDHESAQARIGVRWAF